MDYPLTKTTAQVINGEQVHEFVIVHNIQETYENNIERHLHTWSQKTTRINAEKFTKYLRKKFPGSKIMSEKEAKRRLRVLEKGK